jgi:tripartite-type tricarboxylate transporter receptor subunit TctC
MIDIIVSGLPLVEGGKLRALAVTGPQRNTLLPDVPTVAQSGFPGFAVDQWYAFFAPVGTPPGIVQQVAQDVKVVTESTRLRGLMWQRGAEVNYLAGPVFGGMVQRDWQRWKTVAASTGARAQ